ncbi:MAG: hypothetical protein KBA26_11825 [Candidatus Delongbacteria bacterium]|nr:hypothetical protein [Candidatus Delongbacteria bacterium]
MRSRIAEPALERIQPDTAFKLPVSDGERLKIKGWKTLDFSTGGSADNGLQQSMYLSLNGQISRHYHLTGVLKDYQTPMSEYQEGQKLRSLDQVYLILQGPELKIRMGDFFQEKNRRDYLPERQKVQGIEAVYRNQAVSLGRARGEFSTCTFNGQDGNQGPYYLSANDGNRYIIIIQESEKVYWNGKLLKEGDGQDYTIDYLSAAVYFNPSRMIGSEDRFYVEFEYTSLNYDRYLGGSHVEWSGLALDYYRSSDQVDSDLSYSLSPAERRAMADLEGGIEYLMLDGIDTLAEGEGDYIRQDDHFVYTGSGPYRVSFYYAGTGKGDYLYSGNNSFVYAGFRKGDYLPGRRVETPRTREYYQLEYRHSGIISLETSGSISRYQPNNQSGYAQTGYWITSDFSYQAVRMKLLAKDRSFQAATAVLPAEHARIYNYPRSEPLGDIRWVNLSAGLSSHQTGFSWFSLNRDWDVWHIEYTRGLQSPQARWTCQNWFSYSRKLDTHHAAPFLHSQVSLNSIPHIGLIGMMEYKPQTLYPGDSNFLIIQNQWIMDNPLPHQSNHHLSSSFRREEFYHDSVQSQSNYSLTLEDQLVSRTGSEMDFKLMTAYRWKRYTILRQNEDYYLILFDLKRNRNDAPIGFEWQHQSGIEESYSLARRFKSVAVGTGNYRYDSLLQDYVPDSYGDYILIKEILKSSQTLAGAQENLSLSLRPGYWLDRLKRLEFSYRHALDIKVKQPNSLWRGLVYPMAGFMGEIHKKQHDWQSELIINLSSTTDSIPSLFTHQLRLMGSSRTAIQAYYQDYYQSEDQQALGIKWIGSLNAHRVETSIEKGEKDQRWISIQALRYDYFHSELKWNFTLSAATSFQTSLGMTRYSLDPSGTIRHYSIQESLSTRLYRSIFVTIQFQWDHLSSANDQVPIHYYIASGKQAGSNGEFHLNLSQNVSQKTEVSLDLTLRNYAAQPSQTFVRLSWKSYF